MQITQEQIYRDSIHIRPAPEDAWRNYDEVNPVPGYFEFGWLSSCQPDIYYKRARHDAPTTDLPVHQFVGGGPDPEQATLTFIDATLINGEPSMQIQITNLQNDELFKQNFASRKVST